MEVDLTIRENIVESMVPVVNHMMEGDRAIYRKGKSNWTGKRSPEMIMAWDLYQIGKVHLVQRKSGEEYEYIMVRR